MKLFTEVFPVEPAALPQLFAWKLDGRGDFATMGGKLSYRLRKELGGNWVWSSFRLWADFPASPEKVAAVVAAMWKEFPNIFQGLRAVMPDSEWKPTTAVLADFACRGLLSDAEPAIRTLLKRKQRAVGDAVVDRIHEARGWEVRGTPAISISVYSRLTYKHDLKTYAARLKEPKKLVGLFVAETMSSAKGEITEVVGTLSEHRARLLNLTKRDEMQALIDKAPDDELVVSVDAGGPFAYDYPVSALRIVLRTKDLKQFGINRSDAQKALRIEPGARSELVREVANVLKSKKLVGAAFNSGGNDGTFVTGKDVEFDSRAKFGDGHVAEYDEKTILRLLQQHGVYKRHAKFAGKAALRVAVVNGLRAETSAGFLGELARDLKSLRFDMEVVAEEKANPQSRADLERAVNNLERQSPDILVGLFADEIGEDEEDWASYNTFKSLTVSRGLASQVVYQSTLRKSHAMANIVLGVVGKTGNIPYVRAEALPYADLVVGIDIARKKKDRLAGSINATAITRIYFGNGEFLRYVIHDAQLEGETIPENVMQCLFPMQEFKGKRIVVHRDGFFRGDEKNALKRWGAAIGATFHLVEIIKTGTPRLYSSDGGNIGQPPKGSAFKLSANEAFLVSSLPPFKNATPQPLRVRSEPPFSIEQALNSVLSLTVLHYGSVRSPRLPVTIHYSDRIAGLALQGIKPKNLDGNIPFWL